MKTVTISIVLTTLLLFSTIYAQPRFDGCMGRGFLRLGERLDLTEEQKDKIEDLRSVHQKEVIDLRAELEKVQIKLKDMKRENTLNRKDYLGAIEEMNTIHNKISISGAEMKMDIYELLSDKQKEEFNQLNFGEGRRDGFGMGRRGGLREGLRQRCW